MSQVEPDPVGNVEALAEEGKGEVELLDDCLAAGPLGETAQIEGCNSKIGS